MKVSPDCADAYVILAEETANSAEEARELYQKGVAAGERALGEEMFHEEQGNFWSILETRPYLRACYGLAICQWSLGEHDEALGTYRRILEFNPVDNQGARYTLAGCLLHDGRSDELGALLRKYEEDASAYWHFTRALWRFREEGSSKRATSELRDAIAFNPYVPLYLLGQRQLLELPPPDLIGMGDESKVLSYFIGSLREWLKTPHALEWLRENASEQLLSQVERDNH